MSSNVNRGCTACEVCEGKHREKRHRAKSRTLFVAVPMLEERAVGTGVLKQRKRRHGPRHYNRSKGGRHASTGSHCFDRDSLASFLYRRGVVKPKRHPHRYTPDGKIKPAAAARLERERGSR